MNRIRMPARLANMSRRQRLGLGGGIAAAALAATIAFWPAQAQVNLVDGIPPMSTALSSVAPTINRLGTLPENQRAAYLAATWPHLAKDVVYFLTNNGQLERDKRIIRVEFKFGSVDRIYAQQAGGDKRFGYISDQLVAVIYVEGAKEPRLFIVECTNGMSAPLDKVGKLQTVGSHTPVMQFTIAPGQGLVHHLDFPAAIDVARRCHLEVYRTKEMTPGNRVSYAQALALEPRTGEIQVTVKVATGDTFDLSRGVYHPREGRMVQCDQSVA